MPQDCQSPNLDLPVVEQIFCDDALAFGQEKVWGPQDLDDKRHTCDKVSWGDPRHIWTRGLGPVLGPKLRGGRAAGHHPKWVWGPKICRFSAESALMLNRRSLYRAI